MTLHLSSEWEDLSYGKIDKEKSYLNRIIERKENDSVKIITGIRRSGKSYLLFYLYHDYLIEQGVPEEQIIQIALDDIEFEKYRDPEELNIYIRSKIVNKDMYYIFIDEVQYAISKEELENPENVKLYNVLNGIMRLRNTDIYVTVSNSKLLSQDVMTDFRGRGDQIHIALCPLKSITIISAEIKVMYMKNMLYTAVFQNYLKEKAKRQKPNICKICLLPCILNILSSAMVYKEMMLSASLLMTYALRWVRLLMRKKSPTPFVL